MSNVAVPAAPQSRSSNGAQTSQSSQGQKTGHQRIHKVAVLGAGTMGARIAAHFANAGVPSYLLDIVPPDAAQRRARATKSPPPDWRRRRNPSPPLSSSLLWRAWSPSATLKMISSC